MLDSDQVRQSLNRIVPPIAGGLLGLILFDVLLVKFSFVAGDQFFEKLFDALGFVTGTFVGAWAGGAAAFAAERKTRDRRTLGSVRGVSGNNWYPYRNPRPSAGIRANRNFERFLWPQRARSTAARPRTKERCEVVR
jgi:hypothetical protein